MDKVQIPQFMLNDEQIMMEFFKFMDPDHATLDEMSSMTKLERNTDEFLEYLRDHVRWLVSTDNTDQILTLSDGQKHIDDFVSSR